MSQITESPQDVKELRPLELHYFRVPRERWELMLARLRQMGANAVSTVVPWSWHEPRQGAFDLTGITHPARDVGDFLETCAAIGLRVILRVGPYAGAGLLGGGVPGWLPHEHPEILALGPDSQPRSDPASGGPFPCALHPTYLTYVEGWYQELTGALGTRQRPAGPIVALRLDRPGPDGSKSQTHGIPGHWDYNPHVVEAQWPVWLRQQYDGIVALNAAWGTDYRSFSDAAFPRQPPAVEPSSRFADAAQFVAYAAARTTETYVRMLREAGLTVPILTAPDEPVGTRSVALMHAVQVDAEPPEVGAAVRWAMDAPLRPGGYPRRQFWAVKATLLEMEQGLKQVEGGTLVTGPESRRVRLSCPAGNYGVYRLLLDGRLLDAPSRTRADTLYVDYLAADEAGETDMYFVLDDQSAPLTGFLGEYLAWLLMAMAQTMRRTGAMCRALAEGLTSAESPAGDEPHPALEDLRAAERKLAEAQRAARRAAVSLSRLERLAGDIRGERPTHPPTHSALPAFTPQELERLIQVRDACDRAAPLLSEVADATAALCQEDEGTMTVPAYRAAGERARATAQEVEASLASALRSLRSDLSAGSLSPSAWPVHDRLAHVLRSLAAGTQL